MGGFLGFLITGLGHLYGAEPARAALLFGSAVVAAIASTMAPAAGLALFPIWIYSIVDARRAVDHWNRKAVARPLTGGIWAAAAVAAIGLTVGIAYTSSGADTRSIADQIRPDLENQLQGQVVDADVSVDDLSCVSGSSDGGSCLADVSDSLGNQQKVSISYTVDSDTGQMIWQTTP